MPATSGAVELLLGEGTGGFNPADRLTKVLSPRRVIDDVPIRHLANIQPDLPFPAAVLAGDWIFLSGEIGVMADGKLAPGLVGQARQALSNVDRTLIRLGCGRENIVKCTIMLRDMSRWHDFNAEYLSFFAECPLPARSAFGVAGLAFDAELEIECLAHRAASQALSVDL